ncbi:MAG TPA: peroxide stress protein YaaA, partial [Solirubrobacterales bacterium]|nr:peroxide stress protein YaaA [Solirubrobacterales bacterium]
MLVLLPPSEGKTAPSAGAPVDLDALAFAADLGDRRAALLDALARLVEMPTARAIEQLAVSKGQAGEVVVDAELRDAPAAAAAAVYSGVLYDRLRLPELPASARRRVLIASALWGVLRPEDRIPYYRFSAKARLEGIGPVAAWWREALAVALPDEPGDLVVDMRSAAYAAAWKPKRATLLAVRAFSESGGKRKPVSHMAKAVRGDVARALLLAKRPPTDPEAAAAVAADAGFAVELSGAGLDV